MLGERKSVPELPTNLDSVQATHASFAAYEGMDDPDTILNYGLVIGGIELSDEMQLSVDSEPTESLPGKLGDLFWYATQKAQQDGLLLSEMFSTDMTLDNLQAFAERERSVPEDNYLPATLPIFTKNEGMINGHIESWELLNLIVLRAVDVDSRTDDRLWRGEEAAITTSEDTIRDLIVFISQTANRYGLRLADIYTQTVDKLQHRDHLPRVIADETAPTEGRDRVLELARALRQIDLLNAPDEGEDLDDFAAA